MGEGLWLDLDQPSLLLPHTRGSRAFPKSLLFVIADQDSVQCKVIVGSPKVMVRSSKVM